MSSQLQSIRVGHLERVLAIAYNCYGDRLATASSDQRLKVFDQKSGNWELVDSWRAHDGEVTDIKWNGPLTGSILGSVGEDCSFKLWQEDIAQIPRTGHRFRLIQGPLPSKSALPWVSMDFKNVGTETFLALISYDGNLTIMEPKDHDNLAGEWTDWFESRDFWVCDPTPHRSQNTGFRVCFHHEKAPCWTAVAAGLDRRALSVAVAAMDGVKIFRTDLDKQLYVAAEIRGCPGIIRDLAWANGSVRGCDRIAIASQDSVVRIYELWTVLENNPKDPKDFSISRSTVALSSIKRKSRNAPSGIGARLADAAKGTGNGIQSDDGPGRVKQKVELIAELSAHNGHVWRIQFSPAGDMLTTSGDDALTKTYKHGINKKWYEYAEIGLRKVRSPALTGF